MAARGAGPGPLTAEGLPPGVQRTVDEGRQKAVERAAAHAALERTTEFTPQQAAAFQAVCTEAEGKVRQRGKGGEKCLLPACARW